MNYEQTLIEANKIIEAIDEPGGHIINRPKIAEVIRELVVGVETLLKLEQAIENADVGEYELSNRISDEFRILTGEVVRCPSCLTVDDADQTIEGGYCDESCKDADPGQWVLLKQQVQL